MVNRGKNCKGVPLLLPRQLLNGLHHLNRNIKDVPNFIMTSFSMMKKSDLKRYA